MRKARAFTLIELLIVIVIIGILATFVVVTLGSTARKANNAKAKDSVSKVRESMEGYAGVNGNLSGLVGANKCVGVPQVGSWVNFHESCGSTLEEGGTTGVSGIPKGAKGDTVRINITDQANGYFAVSARASEYTAADPLCWEFTRDATGTVNGLEAADPATCS
jgi:prepilin-type N-terminal cleavage/methylation domain-containing protein